MEKKDLKHITIDEFNNLVKSNKIELISGPKIISVEAGKTLGGDYSSSDHKTVDRNIIGNAPEDANAYMCGYQTGPVRDAVYEGRRGYNHIPIIYLKIEKK